MLHRTVTWAGLTAVLGVLLFVSVPTPVDAQQRSSDPAAEILAVMEAYREAVSNKDIDRCMAAWGSGDDIVMLGTGPGERWLGREEIRDAHLHFFAGFDKESSESTWRMARVSGDVAWGASMVHAENYLKNEKNEFFLNISIVLERQQGQWRIVMFHHSNLTGPDMPPPVGDATE